MSAGAPPEVAGAPAGREGFPWRFALARGLFAFVVVALAGQIVPLVMNVFGAGFAVTTALKLGWLYALTFHRVAIAFGSAADPSYRLSAAFLTGMGLAVFLLYREGRRMAARTRGDAHTAAVAGAAIAPAYAAPFLLLTPLVHLDLIGLPLLPHVTRLEGVVWQAGVFPFALAAVAGGVGGLLQALPRGSFTASALVGGWRTLMAGLGLAIVALLLVAVVRPSGLATYARVVGGQGVERTGLLLGHQVLLLPNVAADVLVPTMGGCVSVHGPGFTVPVVCAGKLPRLDAADLVLALGAAVTAERPPSLSRSMPPAYLVLVLVPALATVGGGWSAASRVDAAQDRLVVGIASGLVFALLVGTTAWFSGVTLRAVRSVTFGARPLPSAVLALAWGVVGGVVGALLESRQLPAVPDVEPAPPRPTSV
jgi:hypothetical protein